MDLKEFYRLYGPRFEKMVDTWITRARTTPDIADDMRQAAVLGVAQGLRYWRADRGHDPFLYTLRSARSAMWRAYRFCQGGHETLRSARKYGPVSWVSYVEERTGASEDITGAIYVNQMLKKLAPSEAKAVSARLEPGHKRFLRSEYTNDKDKRIRAKLLPYL